MHPPGPSRCPVDECDWASLAADKNVVTSIESHLFHKHGIEPTIRKWACRDCDEVESGHDMRYHKLKRCRAATSSPVQTPRLAASLPGANFDASSQRSTAGQTVPVLVVMDEVPAQQTQGGPTTPVRDEFTSFCDSDDCTPQSPVGNASFAPSSASSPAAHRLQTSALKTASRRIPSMPAIAASSASIGLSCPPVQGLSLLAVGPAGLVLPDLPGTAVADGARCADSPTTAAGDRTSPVGHLLTPRGGARAGPATSVHAELQQETDSLLVETSPFILREKAEAPPLLELSSPETVKPADFGSPAPSKPLNLVPQNAEDYDFVSSDLGSLEPAELLNFVSENAEPVDFVASELSSPEPSYSENFASETVEPAGSPSSDLISSESSKHINLAPDLRLDYTASTDLSAEIDDIIAGALRLSTVQCLDSAASSQPARLAEHDITQPAVANLSVQTVNAVLASLFQVPASKDGGAALNPPAITDKTKACLAKHGIELLKRDNIDQVAPAPEPIIVETSMPDIDARWNGSPGWSPKFLAHVGSIDMRPWTSELGMLPLNNSIWSMESDHAVLANVTSHTASPNRAAADDAVSQFAPLIGSPTQRDQPITVQQSIAVSDPPESCASDDSGDLADYESLASASDAPTAPGYANPKQRNFCDTWCLAFGNCVTIEDLESTIMRCMADWLSKTSRKIEQLAVDEDAAQRDRVKRPRRRPDRQLQRLRQREKRSSDEARRIQTMFRIYPKRAVRRALGETSPGFSGSTDAARIFLSDTYERQDPSRAGSGACAF